MLHHRIFEVVFEMIASLEPILIKPDETATSLKFFGYSKRELRIRMTIAQENRTPRNLAGHRWRR